MSLTKRLNRVPYGRVLFAFVVGVGDYVWSGHFYIALVTRSDPETVK